MKYKIEYTQDNGQCWAFSVMPCGGKMFSCGSTWEDARKRHVEKLKAAEVSAPPPQSEEVEI